MKGTIKITVAGIHTAAIQTDERNKEVIFKNFAPFTDCISEINNTQVDNAENLNIVMPMHNLIEYDENYSKLSGSLWQYHRDESDDDDITDCASFKFKSRNIEKTPADGNTKDVEIAVPLKYLSNFWGNLEMHLINCGINLILTWPTDSVITDSTGTRTFKITDRKLSLPVVTLYMEL